MRDKKRMLEVCEQISKDVENDARTFDGKPFNGRIMAEYMGNHGAAIKALADILSEVIKTEES